MSTLSGKRGLDFVVIGASKCGTTSLFEYLRRHPSLYLPPSKDAPFLSADDWTPESWPSARREYFSAASADSLWGTVTPRYMEDSRIPDRLAESMPRVGLIALLRDPVQRALSQYRQQVRRGKETRGFEEAIANSLRAATSSAAWSEEPTERYIRPGEYGRILANFLRRFPAEQLLVLLTEDLRNEPGGVLDKTAEFLGLQPGFRPANMTTVYHRGGGRERFPRLVDTARRFSAARSLWHLVPRDYRRVLWYWYFTKVNVVSEPEPAVDPAVEQSLREYYREDTALLAQLTELEIPWHEQPA